jgi:hypothetical protein
MKPMGLRFDSHLDGVGIERFLKKPCPERRLWKHLKWIRDHKDKITPKTHKRLMRFDTESTVEDFRPLPDAVIAKHKELHDKGKTNYKGPTRSKMRLSKYMNCVDPVAEFAGDSEPSDNEQINSNYLQSSYS